MLPQLVVLEDSVWEFLFGNGEPKQLEVKKIIKRNIILENFILNRNM